MGIAQSELQSNLLDWIVIDNPKLKILKLISYFDLKHRYWFLSKKKKFPGSLANYKPN
jgi:hypothetical protein